MASVKTCLLLLTGFACATTNIAADDVDYKYPVRDQNADLITNLPGLTVPINFRQYSGYLNADDSPNPRKFLHYWFVESQTDPDKAPLLLWLNGGPGCSSLGGFFGELGPFSVNNDGRTLSIRDSSWNKNANVIFLESPTGVGYSYSTKRESLDDNVTAKQNHLAIKSFLKKFPQFKDRPFYISGESYGGVYLPTLGVRLDQDQEINFKGIAIGNGYLDADKLGKSLVFFAYYHGLLGKTFWQAFSEACCDNKPPELGACSFQGAQCTREVNSAMDKILNSGINPYNYASDCLKVKDNHESQRDARIYGKKSIANSLIRMSLNATSEQAYPFKIFESRSSLSKFREEPPCMDDTTLITYLDLPEVRKAIHIPSKLDQWAGPCAEISYAMIYPQRVGGLAPQMQKLIDSKRNLSILIYNGDLDMMCNFYGCEQFSDDLGREVVDDFQQWSVNNQVAGYFKNYKGFSFVTVKAAGHMVPTDKGDESLAMITRWLLKQ